MSIIDDILSQTHDFNFNTQNLILTLSNDLGKQYQPNIDLIWYSLTTYVVFFMQVGFAFLEFGTVRFKNQANVLLKTFLNILLGTLWWWWIGYGFAFGDGGNGYIGGWYFCAIDFNKSSSLIKFTFAHWFENWAWLCVTLTIISGAVAGRIRLEGFALLQMFVSTWVYPIIVSWIWRQNEGWLAVRGFIDWSGAVGGYAALAAALILKPRIGRFVKNVDQSQFAPNDQFFVAIGTLCLWFGFYGFIPGASQVTSGQNVSFIGRCGMNQTLSACTGGITSFIIHAIANRKNENKYSLRSLCNGIIGGIVALCAIPNGMEPEGAFVTGIIAGIIYQTLSKLLLLLQIDDPCDAFPIHGGCGYLGLVISGIFHRRQGIFYGAGAKLFGTQIYGGVCIAIWSFLMTAVCLLIVNFLGFLRVAPDQERIGLDEAEFCNDKKGQVKTQPVEEFYQKVVHTEQHHHQPQVVTKVQQDEKGLEMNIKQKEDSEYMYNTDQLQFQ